ncbi:MAG TPA: hypothetical protein VHF08_04370 [Nitrososphaeraceae archaeon]|nr:hypothetical protein [Nitrososphaeraceae archaeon]
MFLHIFAIECEELRYNYDALIIAKLHRQYISYITRWSTCFIVANHFRVSINIIGNMSKTLLYNGKSEVEEEEQKSQVKIPNVFHEQHHQQEEEDKEFIILKIYKSEIDKAIEDLKEHKKINQYYEPDYKLIVERYTDKILDVYGWYESLKQTIRTTDRTSMLERDEL